MNYKKIGAACKRARSLTLITRADGRQYVSCGGAVWPTGDLPAMNLDQIAAVLGLTAKDMTKILAEEKPEGPAGEICGLQLENQKPAGAEDMCELPDLRLIKGGRCLQPVRDGRGTVDLLDRQLLETVGEVLHSDYLRVIRQTGAAGTPGYLLQDGFHTVAALAPMRLPEGLLEDLSGLLAGLHRDESTEAKGASKT